VSLTASRSVAAFRWVVALADAAVGVAPFSVAAARAVAATFASAAHAVVQVVGFSSLAFCCAR
jgi:hypothetical protein